MKKQIKIAGFTLIELMVVIAIIGVLAVTIIPQLTGAQARARDTGRIANVKSVAAVLETYNSDEGIYPLSPSSTSDINDSSGTDCLSSNDGTVHAELAALFKNGVAPVDPQKGNESGNCSVAGSIGYSALVRDSVDQGGYMLITNVEIYKKANIDFSTVTLNAAGTSDYSSISALGWGKLASETTDAGDSVYAELN